VAGNFTLSEDRRLTMDISGLTFSNETHWESSRQALFFFADIGNKRIACGISQIALNDYYRTADTKEMAIKNYESNKEFIQGIATKFIKADLFNDKGEIFITSKEFK
jgi:hypothetical protein